MPEDLSPSPNLFPTPNTNPTTAQAAADPEATRDLDLREAVLEAGGYTVDRQTGRVDIVTDSNG